MTIAVVKSLLCHQLVIRCLEKVGVVSNRIYNFFLFNNKNTRQLINKIFEC
jgi:hypothetical protein